jgi:hypothetical protein
MRSPIKYWKGAKRIARKWKGWLAALKNEIFFFFFNNKT